MFFFIVFCFATHHQGFSNPGCAERRDGLDSLSLLPQSLLLSACVLSIRLFNWHTRAFLFKNRRRRNKENQREEREREHRRFWNTHTPKKETEEDALRAFAHAYNSLFLATPPLWSTTITRRAFLFCICSLTASDERTKDPTHSVS
jgi:hypothetical protein